MKDKKCTLRPPLSLRACPVALSLPMVARVGQQRISGSLLPSLDPYFAPLRSAKHQIYANVSRHATPISFQTARYFKKLL